MDGVKLGESTNAYPATSVTRPPPTTKTGSYSCLVCSPTRVVCAATHLANNAELRHGVADAKEGFDRLGLFADGSLVNLQVQIVVSEILLHLLSVDVVDVLVHDGQYAPPFCIAVCEVAVGFIEDAIHEGEVVLDFLVPLYMKPMLGLGDVSLEIGHFRFEMIVNV